MRAASFKPHSWSVGLVALALVVAWCGPAAATTRVDLRHDLGTLSAGDPAGSAREVALAATATRRQGEEDFIARRVATDALGKTHVRFSQTIAGLPVAGVALLVHADKDGSVYAVQGDLAVDRDLPRAPRLDAREALAAAVYELGLDKWQFVSDAQLTYVLGPSGKTYLTWAATTAYQGAQGPERDILFADAMSGMLVVRHPQIHRARYRQIYNANHGTSLPGSLMFTEGGSSGDATAMDAYDYSGDTYDFYSSHFGRDSYDDNGATLRSSVHYSSNYNNAFWNGSQMVYGDGDGSTFSPLSGALDVVAHELTHAVTDSSADLVYQNESGALNEALSDIMGAATEAWIDGAISANTWKLGEDIYTPGTSGDALRYMDDPTADGSSRDYYPERYTGSSDNGGVHWNSGIANLAFVLLTEGGTHPRGKTSVNVPAIGISKAQQIFYRALTVYMGPNTDFAGARSATALAAADLYAQSDVDAVHDAWDAVGVPGGGGGGGGGALTNGVPVSGLSGSSGSQVFYTLAVPSGASNLVFQISGGSGDADLYVRFGSPPTTSSYNCRPYLNGNNETCTFAAPQAGTWHVMLRGYTSYSGVTLVGSFDTGGGGAPCTGCDHYTGSLSGTGDADIHPNGTYYYSGSGTHHGWLEGPGSTDFDLYLYKWNGNGWSQVANSLSSSSSEEISYYGSSGYYYWRIYSYSGSGAYDFWLDRP